MMGDCYLRPRPYSLFPVLKKATIHDRHRFSLFETACLIRKITSKWCPSLLFIYGHNCSIYKMSRGFLFATTKTLRKSALQNSVKIQTVCTFADSQAHLITINHHTKLVSNFRRPTELGCKKDGLPKSQTRARNIVNISLLLGGKWWLEKIRPFIKKIRNDSSY